MKYCTITPNRGGERGELMQFCLDQLKRMNGGQHITNAYIMNDRPLSDQCDLVPRIKHAVELAKRDGFEWAFIVESDDSYPDDYFNRFLPYLDNFDFVGDPYSIYYNIRDKRYTRIHHHGRASLFTTGFRISALDKYKWPPDNHVFFDMDLWKYVKKYKFRCKFVDSGAVGIKGHGAGKTGGKGHRMKLQVDDPFLHYLKNKVQEHHYDFYTNLMTRL